MDTEREQSPNTAKHPSRPRFRWDRLPLWGPVCLILGAAVAWAATLVEPFSAPVLLFSLLVGAVLGASLIGTIRLFQIANRPTVLGGTVVAALIAVVGQHYFSYRTACRAAVEDRRTYQLAQLAFRGEGLAQMPVPPEGFFPFLRWRAARGLAVLGYKAQGWIVWLLWASDGALVLAAALGVVWLALNRPYCDLCRSWFRTTRGGSVDPQTARRLAELVQAELPEPLASARYRLFACRAGCGPAGLELYGVGPKGDASRIKAWLDLARRDQIVQALDQRMSRT